MFHAVRSECFEACPVGAIIYENTDGPGTLRGRCGFRGEPPIYEMPFNLILSAGALKRFALVRFGVEDDRPERGHDGLRAGLMFHTRSQ